MITWPRYYLCLLLLISSAATCAETDYFRDHQAGWHWYQDDNQTAAEKKLNKAEQQAERERRINSKMDTIQRNYEIARKAMILNPSEANVLRYINLQYALLKQADRVTNTWQKVISKYSNARPNQTADLNLLSEKTGLFFFYRSTCPYCHKFAPIVQQLAARYQLKVIAISIDGIALAEFPDSRQDHGQAEQFAVTAVPALFIVNPYNQRRVQIANGYIGYNQLQQKLLASKDEVLAGEIS